MEIRIFRILFTAVVFEVLKFLIYGAFFILSFVFLPTVSILLGVLIGSMLFMIAGWWVARGLERSHALNGLILGIVVVAFDITFYLSNKAELHPLIFFSYLYQVFFCTKGAQLAIPKKEDQESSRIKPEPSVTHPDG